MTLFLEIQRCLEAGQRIALATVIRAEGSSPRKIGARMLVRTDGSIEGTIGGGTVEHRVIERALEVLRRGEAEVYRVHLTRELGMCCGGAMDFFIEPLEQEPTLLIFGAGHVGRELCTMADRLGFAVTVIDEREDFATLDRFPAARSLMIDDPLEALKTLPTGLHVYAVIVTHLHRLDEDLLRALSPKVFAYLGMIGSRAKVAKFIDRLEARGVSREALDQVRMPIGLDIGAVTPAEIAVSIASELIQVRRAEGRPQPGAGTMRWRPGAAPAPSPTQTSNTSTPSVDQGASSPECSPVSSPTRPSNASAPSVDQGTSNPQGSGTTSAGQTIVSPQR